MATARSLSNPDKENFFRMSVLIVDYALKVLQDVLQKELENRYPNLFDPNTGLLCRVLGDATVRTTLFGLSPKVFNYHQRNQLYPARNPSSSVTVGDLDITLTVLLLRNITTLNPHPGQNAWDNPSGAETSTEANIGRVKRYRNILYGHANKAAICDQDFRAHFSGLKSNLLALSSMYTDEDYDAILSKPLDAALLERNQSILKEWCDYDRDVKDCLMSMQATLEESHEQIIHGLKEGKTKMQGHVEQVQKRSEDTILRKMDGDSQNTHNQLEEISQGITQVNVCQSEMTDQLRHSQKCMEEVKNAQKQDSQNIQAQLEKGAEGLASLRSTQGLQLQMTKEIQENVQTICDRDRDTPEFQKIPGSVDVTVHMSISPSGMEAVKSSAIFSSSQKTPSAEDTQPDRETLLSVTGGGSDSDQITGIAAHPEGEPSKNITQTVNMGNSDEPPTASIVPRPPPEDTIPLCEAKERSFIKICEQLLSQAFTLEDSERAVKLMERCHAMFYDTKRQCFIIRLVCPSVYSLDQLWQCYHCGELQAAVEESFVSIKNLEDLGLSHADIKLWVEIDEDDYKECRKYIEEKAGLEEIDYEDLKMTVRKGPHGSAEQTIYSIRQALMAAFSLRKEDILIKRWDYDRPGDWAVICYGIQPHHLSLIEDNIQDLPKDDLRELGVMTITIGKHTLRWTVLHIINAEDVQENDEICRSVEGTEMPIDVTPYRVWFSDSAHAVQTSDPVGANAPDVSSVYTQRFARLSYLVIELGTKVIRTFFLKDVVRPSITNGEHISDKDAVLQFFGKHEVIRELEKLKKTKVIFASQWNLLYPASGHTDVETFDITLLVLLIRKLHPDKANLKWSAPKENATVSSPPQTTQGFIDHIQRLKNVRNYIQHSAKYGIQDMEKFCTKWENAYASVLALGADPNEVEKVQKSIFSIQEIDTIVCEIRSSAKDNKQHFDSRFDMLELLIFPSVCAVLCAVLIALAINYQWWI